MVFSRSRRPSSWTPFVLSSVAVVAASLGAGECVRGGDRKTSPPLALGALDSQDYIADQVVVDFKDGTTKALYDVLEKAWGVDVEFNSVEGALDGITVGHVDASRRDAVLEVIRRDPNVERAEPLYRYHADFVPNDPRFEDQWNFELIHAREAWDMSQGEGVVVAVLDTGIAFEDYGEFRLVPDLKGTRFVPGYDFVNKDEHANDDQGHGTHVAGTIAQATNNGEGVAGIAFKAKLMPVKVLDANGSGTSADIADAIRWAADHGAQVINMSLGGGARSSVVEAAVAYARKRGTVVVAAAGNAARATVEYPAALPGVVAVSAVGPTGELASYSSWGKELDIAAPGGDKRLRGREQDGVLQNTIVANNPAESHYAWFNGTSMAAPHVAGVAALLWAAGAKSPEEVERALFDGARHGEGGEWNEKLGHGVLDAQGALKALGAIPTERPRWKRVMAFVWALALWLLTRMTLPLPVRRAATPGIGFLAGIVLATIGLFFLPWLGIHSLSAPMPEWGALGGKAHPLFASAVVPVLVAFLGHRSRRFAGALAGLSIGFASVLLLKAWTGGAVLAGLPHAALAIPWLLVNTAILLLLARAALKGQAEKAR